MIGGDLLRRVLGEGARRLALLLVAVVVLAVVFQLFCAAAVIALNLVLPLWAAVVITATTALVVAMILLAAALRQPASLRGTEKEASSPQEQAFELGETMGAAMRRRPKTTLAIATLVGLVLGYDPALRRDILDLLRENSKR